MPTIPFMGVRISWLILAKNSLLARLVDGKGQAVANLLQQGHAGRGWQPGKAAGTLRVPNTCSPKLSGT